MDNWKSSYQSFKSRNN